MRALLLLAVLLAVLLGAILWRLGQPSVPPPSPLEQDPTVAVLTVGLEQKPAPGAQPPAQQPGPDAQTNPAEPQHGEQPQGTNPQGPAPQGAGGAAQAPVVPADGERAVVHLVAPGETLYSIVRAAYGRAPAELVAAVARANHLEDAARMRAGQQLTLPRVTGFPDPR